MFKNYLKMATRHSQKHKKDSIINILGLSIGLACFILIIVWAQDEYENIMVRIKPVCITEHVNEHLKLFLGKIQGMKCIPKAGRRNTIDFLLLTALVPSGQGYAAEKQNESISVEEILAGVTASAHHFNQSLQELRVRQTITFHSTVMGDVNSVKQIHFKAPDLIEQTVINREEKLRKGVHVNLNEDSLSYSLFTASPLSDLSEGGYAIQLIGEESIRERAAFILKVKPNNPQENGFHGKLWIDKQDFTLVKYEGEPLKQDNSDETRGKEILEYSKVDDQFWLPVRDTRKASWIMLIKLTHETVYTDYEIIRQNAANPDSQPDFPEIEQP